MAITTVPLTGKLTAPGSGGIAVRGTVAAFPNTTNYALSFSADNENTLGPVVADVAADGTFTLDIPVNSDQQASLLWTIVVKTSERVPGLNKTVTWTPGTFAISAAVDLADLEAVVITSVSETQLANFSAMIDDATAAATQAETAAAEAAAFGGTNNEQVAGMIEGAGPTRDALAARTPVTGFVMEDTSEATATGTSVLPIGSIDGIAYGRHNTTGALYSTSDGDTWTLVTSAAGGYAIHALGDGEVLLNGSTVLRKSSGWATNPATATWSTVATANGTSTFIVSDVATYDNIVIAAEYANPRTDARYLKVSVDYGATFTNVRDLNTMYPADVIQTHWHAVAIDHWHTGANPRLWASYGDGPRGVIYSDDLGATWTEYGPLNTWQPMPLMATEHGIVTSTDQNNPDGVWLIPRDLSPRVALARIPAAYWSASLLGFGIGATRDEDTGIVYMTFRADSPASINVPRPALIFATDGERADIIYETVIKTTPGDANSTLNWTGLPAITASGHLLTTYNSIGSVTTTVRGKVRRGTARKRLLDAGNVQTGTTIHRDSNVIGYGATGAARAVIIGTLGGQGLVEATDERVVAIGQETTARAQTVVIGFQAKAQGIQSTAVGNLANATTTEGTAIGSEATAYLNSVAVGRSATAGTVSTTGPCVAIGRNAVASANGAISIGQGTASGLNALTIGGSATGSESLALGGSASASNTQTVAVGSSAAAAGTYGIAVGRQAAAPGTDGIAIGRSATSGSGQLAVAIGQGASGATFWRGVALGSLTTLTDNDQIQIGARHIELAERATDPAAPAADRARWFTRDNGSGKTQLCVRFNTGAVQILATEP